MPEILEERIGLSLLYDFYGDLLSDNKKAIFEEYVQDDMSLSEVADSFGISRQGVHDIVKRCISELKKYEEVLRLVENSKKITENIEELSLLCNSAQFAKDDDKKRAIYLLDEIRQEF